jgi:NHL repeat
MMPTALAYDMRGNLFVADQAAQRIRLIAGGRVTTIAGSGSDIAGGQHVAGGYRDGDALVARFNEPAGVAVAADGTIFVADLANHCIRTVKDSKVSTYAGAPDRPGTADGTLANAEFMYPHGLSLDADGNLYVADFQVGIRKIDKAGNVTTVALQPVGPKTFTGVSVWGRGNDLVLFAVDGHYVHVYRANPPHSEVWGNAVEADVPFPHLYSVVAVGPTEAIMGDVRQHVIRLYRDPDRPYVTTMAAHAIAGTALEEENDAAGYADGPAATAKFSAPAGVAIWRNMLAIADGGNRVIRIMPLPDLRGPVGTDLAQLLPDPAGYRIILLSSSHAFWMSTWGDSIGGLLEAKLNAQRTALGIPRPANVAVVRVDSSNLQQESDYIESFLGDGQANLIIWIVNVAHSSGLPTDAAGSPWPAFSRILRTQGENLARAGTRLVVVVAPEGANVAPFDNFLGRQTDGAMPTFHFDASGERIAIAAVRDAGVPYVALLDAMVAHETARAPTPLFGPSDTHFSRAGNAFVAEAIYKELATSKPWDTSKRTPK